MAVSVTVNDVVDMVPRGAVDGQCPAWQHGREEEAMVSQIVFEWSEEHLEALNQELDRYQLYNLGDVGGRMGEPLLRRFESITPGATGTTVVLKMLFPRYDDVMPHLCNDKADVTLRFNTRGGLYDESVVKTYAGGVLWEGTIHAFDGDRQWYFIWKRA